VRPVIALLSDFGLRDHYVASMKGTILGICPDASLVDITHEIPPQDVAAGALELAACCTAFPAGSIFLAVVDPGVGSGRRALAAAVNGRLFVGPDNGLLAPILERAPSPSVVELNRSAYAAAVVSRTFEGRDRFAPAAAWLATGVPLEALGDRVDRWNPLQMSEPAMADGRVDGEVVRVDRFGNLVTNITAADVDRACGQAGLRARVSVAGGEVVTMADTYADVPRGALCALIGSTGHVEVAVNGSSAAGRLGVTRGARVTVECSGVGQALRPAGQGSA
jgi:S-adenosylmethionine hydrolase